MKKRQGLFTFSFLLILWASTLEAHSLKHSSENITKYFLRDQTLDTLYSPSTPKEVLQATQNRFKKILRHSEAYLFLDRDGDGTNDKFDKDIDGDGVFNLLDTHPFDKKLGQKDSDGDGLYDFVDAQPEGIAQSEYGRVQELIFHKTGITLLASEVKFSSKNLNTIKNALTEGIFEHLDFAGSLNVIVLRPEKDQINLNKASYNPNWNTINIYKVSSLSSPRKFKETFFHEMGHVFGKIAHKEKKEQLSLESPNRIHPSKYAETNFEEWFAEAFVSTLYLIGEIDTINTNRYHLLSLFDGTEDFYAIKEMWEKRKGKEATSFPFR